MNRVGEDSPAPGRRHIASLLTLALGRLQRDMLADSAAVLPGLRVSHLRLLELIPPDGTRITDLAELAGMTKQGLGQHVDHLQTHGYVESARLPADGRVRLVRRTARGDEAVAFTDAALARVESSWRQQLGADRYAVLREALAELGHPDR